MFKAAIFDLDGVIVDTAKYHYLAWKRLANQLGFEFTKHNNELLKGVSRDKSLEILLDIGGFNNFSDTEKVKMMNQKNQWYLEYIEKINESEILPGAREYLLFLKDKGKKLALGSASKNAKLILDKIKLTKVFNAIVDGNDVNKAKPNPEVFLLAAKKLNVPAQDCVVFEDAQAGIEAANAAGMRVVGIGNKKSLKDAFYVIPGLCDWTKIEI